MMRASPSIIQLDFMILAAFAAEPES